MQEMACFLHCTVLYFVCQVFYKFFKLFRTSMASLDPETVQLLTFYILSAMFTGMGGPAERLSLALVPCSNVLSMIVKLAN